MKVLILLLILTGCSSTQKQMPSCTELRATIDDSAIDQMNIETCFNQMMDYCTMDNYNCMLNYRLACVENHFQQKLDQTKAFRAQKCWVQTQEYQ